jgi:aromatic-L-amino-acid/L-tryptophan decarboxylase
MYGARRYQAALAEKRALTLEAVDRFAAIPGIVIDARPQLSLFAFHLEWPEASVAEQNAATKALLERVVRRGRVFLTGCTAGGRFLGRVCILSFRTRRQHMLQAVEDTEAEAGAILHENGYNPAA